MALTVNHPTLKEVTVFAHTASAGGTPISAVTRAPFRGKIVKVGGVLAGTLTSADAAVVVIVNGTTVTGCSAVVIPSTNSLAGTSFSATPTGTNTCNEDDPIIFTPSAASGSNIPCNFYAVIQAS